MMAHITTGENEELSNEQIQQLLQEAEARLKDCTEDDHESSTRKPSLDHKILRLGSSFALQELALRRDRSAATTNPKLLVGKKMRQLTEEVSNRLLFQKEIAATSSKRTNNQATAGPGWFDMPRTVVTDQLKRDLQLLEMRSVLDPHRHYKKDSRKGKVPTFSQMGTVVEGPTEWYSSRINRKQRSKNFVEEAMATERDSGRFKRKYAEIQDKKMSGKKAHYKKLMAKRRGKS